jgi:photosystem II stability/assembly factor-like uncharacterized protein
MMRTITKSLCICFLSGMVFCSLPQENPWEKIQSPVNTTLRKLSFTDSLNGWATGQDGIIIHTSNGGSDWELQNSTVQTFITDIFFVNDLKGWAVTVKDVFPFNTVILKTNDGGVNWVAENFQDTTAFMRTIFFFDSLNGFIGGSYIAYTSDGGDSWTKSDVDSNMVSSYPVYAFNFHNRKFGYACGGRKDVAGVIWRTTNYGLNWTAQGISPDEIFDVFAFDSLNAITLSGDPEGLFPTANIRTTDGGINWSYENLPFFGLSFTIDFRTYNDGWSASGYKFLHTTDRGETWNEADTPDSSTIYDLQFTDSRNGYAVGDNGVVLKLDPSLVDVKDEKTLPGTFILYQNYPNPFNPSTKIKFTLPSGETRQALSLQTVTLKIYDVLGNEVATLVDEYKPAGAYEVEFNVTQVSRPEIASGVYFYQLRVGDPETSSGLNQIQTKKMILLK